jgi:Uma2 family endonuclease
LPNITNCCILGQIVLHSPASDAHTDAVTHLITLQHIFATDRGLGKTKSEKAMISLTRNDYEPDVAFWKKEVADSFEKTQTHFPAPHFVVEVLSKGTAKTDRTTKYRDYAAHQVEEYWIVDPKKQTVEQYVLPQGATEYMLFKKLMIDDDISSYVMKGFTIPVKAIFDAQTNLETLKHLLIK